jgi:predicted oxidoreductase (fatty acid repression mutant protein)
MRIQILKSGAHSLNGGTAKRKGFLMGEQTCDTATTSAKSFWQVVEERRSNYTIGKTQTLAPARIEELIKRALATTPSAFNSQPARAVLLLEAAHERFWALVWEALQEKVAPESLTKTKPKIDSFAAGYATILFFVDESVVHSYEERFPSFAAGFKQWSRESTGMLQFVIWSALDAEGLGVSLQHYNPLVDERVRNTWDIPADWTLIGQMVCGSREAAPLPKTPPDAEELLRVFQQ